jgi:hypothetical protein
MAWFPHICSHPEELQSIRAQNTNYILHLHSCRHRRGGDFTSPNFGLRSGYMKYIRLSLCTYIYTIMLMNILCLLWFKMVLVARVFWPFLLGLGYDQCFILADASSGVDRADEQTVAMAGGPKGTHQHCEGGFSSS